MSVFVPPSPTAAVAALDGASNLGTSTSSGDNANSNTDPFTQNLPPSADTEDDSSASSSSSSNPNDSTTTGAGGNSTTNNKGIQSSTELPLPTKIGIGVGMGAGAILLVVVVVFVLWKKRMGGKRRSRSGGAGDGGGGFEYDPERDSAVQHTPQEKAKMDFESEHDVAFDFGAFFRDRKAQSPSSAKSGSVGSRVSVGSGSVAEGKIAELEDRLPAFEAPRGGGQAQQQQAVVAELDGGGVPEYRGVVGVGR